MTNHVSIDFPEISPHYTPALELKPKNINDELTEALKSSKNSVKNPPPLRITLRSTPERLITRNKERVKP